MTRRAISMFAVISLTTTLLTGGCAPRGGASKGALTAIAASWAARFAQDQVDTNDGSIIRDFWFQYNPQDETVESYNTIILAAGKERNRAFFAHLAPGAADVESFEYTPASTRERITLDLGVPLADLAKTIDQLGLKRLIATDATEAYGELTTGNEQGRVLGREDQSPVYIVEQGKVRKLEPGELAVVSGRMAQLHVWTPGGVKPGALTDCIYLLRDFCGEVEMVHDVHTPRLQDGMSVMDTKLADVDGDGEQDYLYLIGSKSSPDLAAPDRRQLLVVNGKDISPKEVRGDWYDVAGEPCVYGASLTVRDLTGDGRPEILVRDYVGGSGGIIELNVYDVAGNTLTPLFRAADHHTLAGLRNEYIGGGIVRTSSASLGMAWEYGAYSPDLLAADEAQIREQFSPDWVDPLSGYDFADLDGDGTVEIISRQAICGTCHADVIGFLRQVFAWDGTAFILKDVGLYNARDNLIQRKGQ